MRLPTLMPQPLKKEVPRHDSGCNQSTINTHMDQFDKRDNFRSDDGGNGILSSKKFAKADPRKPKPDSFLQSEQKLQNYVTADIDTSSPNSVESGSFASGKVFWMKFLDDSRSHLSDDCGERRMTPIGREIKQTWSSGSPLSDCSAFNWIDSESPRSTPRLLEAVSSRTERCIDKHTDLAARNDENSGHRRASTGGLRDQPSPLFVARRSAHTPESGTQGRLTPRYFGDVTNRIDHCSPSQAPNSHTKPKSRVAELAENFQKEFLGERSATLPPVQSAGALSVVGPNKDFGKTPPSKAQRVMTSSTPIPNSSNARLAESPVPDPVIEMGVSLDTATNKEGTAVDARDIFPHSKIKEESSAPVVTDDTKSSNLPTIKRELFDSVEITNSSHLSDDENKGCDSNNGNDGNVDLDGHVPRSHQGVEKDTMASPAQAERSETNSADDHVQSSASVESSGSGQANIAGKQGTRAKIDFAGTGKTNNSGFTQLLKKWRDKSDDKPNAHFLSPEQESKCTDVLFHTNCNFSPEPGRLRIEDDPNRSKRGATIPLVQQRIQAFSKDHFDVVREKMDTKSQEKVGIEELDPSPLKRPRCQPCDDADSPPQIPKVNSSNRNLPVELGAICEVIPSSAGASEKQIDTNSTSQAIVILKNNDEYQVLIGETKNNEQEQVVVRNVEMVTSTEQENYEQESMGCECSRSVFSGNDDLISFFLPKMGMACTCGRQTRQFVYPDDPTAIENILRPWQVEFLKGFGIHRGDQLVKARHRSANLLAKALRQWRKKKGMIPFKTSACGMAIHIWAKTCKAFVRSIRKQANAGTLLLDQQPAELAQEFSNFLGTLPAAPDREEEGIVLAIEPDSQVEV